MPLFFSHTSQSPSQIVNLPLSPTKSNANLTVNKGELTRLKLTNSNDDGLTYQWIDAVTSNDDGLTTLKQMRNTSVYVK